MSETTIIPTQTKETNISPLWLFTLLALILGGWLLYKSISEAGIRIHIHFNNAEGIEAGRTAIRYQGIDIGIIRKIGLKEDLTGINAEAEIFPNAAKLLRKDTLFWLVKPKATINEISGLETLVGGNYISMLPGKANEEETYFIATVQPPNITPNSNNVVIYLTTHELDSLSIGSGVYFKKIKVGEVFNYELIENNQSVRVSIQINEKYAHLVKKSSRFWNISGVKANAGLHGVNIEVASLPSLLAGGIAFDSPKEGEKSSNYSTFTLYPSINETERGIAINIKLPIEHGIKDHNLAISYKGTEIGKLKSIESTADFTGFIAKANIDPSMEWLLKTGSKFIIEQPEINFSKVKNLTHFITGNTLSIEQGKGENTTTFVAQTKEQSIYNHPNTLKLRLTTENVWGISNNTKIIYKGVEVGFVHQYELSANKTYVDLVIYPNYRHLVKSNSRFYRLGGVSASLDNNGLAFDIAPVAQLMQGAISFTSDGKNKLAKSYHLYDSQSQAEKAKFTTQGYQKLTLVADKLPSISLNSPVMYKNVTVGKVKDFVLEKNRVKVILSIENQYKHLLTKDTVFWDHSGVDVQANFSGINIETASLKSIMTGGISFGNLQGIPNKEGSVWILYNSLTEAQNQGISIRLSSKKTYGLKTGSEIRYQGIRIGEVSFISPNFEQEAVQITAMIYPEFAKRITKKSSYFWVSLPSISFSKTENLDSLFGSYISVRPGKGSMENHFTLHESQQFIGGLALVLETAKRNSITVGTPILFRDFEVGSVTNVRLGYFADRVLIEIKIREEHKHLVRQNSIFWNNSGIDVSVGLSGANIKTGTVENILRGGIAFATPKTKVLAPIARKNQHFLLHSEPKAEWKEWNTAIAPPN